MSTLELKGSIYNTVARVNDSSLLTQINELLSEIVSTNLSKTDFWDELSTQQKSEIQDALEESKNEKNLIAHSDVMKKYKKWLK